MSESLLSGHCFCSAVRYRCGDLLYPPTLCHCESCRRLTGAHAVAWITVPANSLVYVQGTPAEFRSSPEVLRSFCGHCGTPLTYYNQQRADEIDITLMTLDSPEHIVPADHIWMADALPWDRPHDGLPQYQKTRELP
ncbi:MAG: GFA family protein [Steroidobacteraceae bacterium]